MKQLITQLILGLTIAGLLSACGSSKTSIGGDGEVIIEPEVITETDPEVFPAKFTLDFPDYSTVLEYGTNGESVVPESVQVEISLDPIEGGVHEGTAKVTYQDTTGREYSRTYRTGRGEFHNRYNKWITGNPWFEDNISFHAIFDDGRDGALVFVISQTLQSGDGVEEDLIANGSIWYYNYIDFNPGLQADHPQTRGHDTFCWEVSEINPYFCLPWVNQSEADSVQTPRIDSFSVLGQFINVRVLDIFNGNINYGGTE